MLPALLSPRLVVRAPVGTKKPQNVHGSLEKGAEVIFVWGGDGAVQRCIDALAGTKAILAILPAGTANLLAENLVRRTTSTFITEIGENRGQRN